MMTNVEIPLWALLLLTAFAAVTFASHFLFPSVRWFFRKRAERVIAQLNKRLTRPIQPFKLASRLDTINRLIHDPQIAQAIVDHARAKNIPEEVAFETAKRYAREIVPGFSAILYFSIATRMARWLSRSLYRVRVTGEAEALADIDPDATVIFVLNHRSNMDYVLVTWLAARRTALAYAVGEWARRWPLRPLIRAMGGYFVRRRDLNALYRRVLARYVQIATQNGVTQAFFPESRLSRTGAIEAPKLGILSYLVAERDSDMTRDVVFVPVALNYERVLEDRMLVAAAGAEGPNRFRLRWWMVLRYLARHAQLRLTGRFRRFGYAAVSFGEPLSLSRFMQDQHDDATAALGAELMDRIKQVLPVLPLALVAEALLEGRSTIDGVARHLAARQTAFDATRHPVHHALRDSQAMARAALDMLAARNLIEMSPGVLQVTPDGKDLLAFYARTLPVQKTITTENYTKGHIQV